VRRSCDGAEEGNGAQESTERIHIRGKTSWKAPRMMFRCCGQRCYEDVEMQELEKVGRG
jgi:hypothetical protein